DEVIVIDYTSKATVIGDTFNIVYAPPDTESFNSGAVPEAIYTFRSWQPQVFEFSKTSVQRVQLGNYEGRYWLARVVVPSDAQMVSFYVRGVAESDSLKTENFLTLTRRGSPVKASYYRIATALLRSKYPIDTVMTLLQREIALYPDSYDAYILYWTLGYGQAGRNEEALAKIEQQMSEARTLRREDPNLLEAIAITYIYGLGDRRKGYDITRDIPDAYLHPLNLYNRFLMERDYDKRESALGAMTDKYLTHPLTPQMYLSLLNTYISDQKNSRERAALFSENILNRRLSPLRASRVQTYSARYLFNYYASIDISKAIPYASDVLRVDYDRDVYDEISILDFAERFAGSEEYSGLALDLAGKSLQALEQTRRSAQTARTESEIIQTPAARERMNTDLQGRAYYVVGKAYRSAGNMELATENLLRANSLCLSRKGDIARELALVYKNTDAAKAFTYAAQAVATNPTDAEFLWLAQNFKAKNVSLEKSVEQARLAAATSASGITLKTIDGRSIKLDSSKDRLSLLYFWSPNSNMSRTLLADLQTLYAKYRARGVDIYAIDAEGELKTVRDNRQEFSYSFELATASATVQPSLGIAYLPSAVIVQNGKAVYRDFGYRTDFLQTLEVQLQSLLSDFKPKSGAEKPKRPVVKKKKDVFEF
ncbi:MAG: TlpA family protein disulfide reductase, partial [Rhizobacter sp.]|nr:TlpA family protein disulfide reductase [Chlorobiales bacterium]